MFTSGGPIAIVASHLLTGDASAFQRINDVMLNAAVTTVIVGSTVPGCSRSTRARTSRATSSRTANLRYL